MSTENNDGIIFDISPRILFVGVVIFAITNLFAVSGIAQQINYNHAMGLTATFCLFMCGSKFTKDYCFLKPSSNLLYYFTLILWITYILLNYRNPNQIVNFITIFGLPFFVCILASLNWNNLDYLKIGITLNILSCLLVWLFLPGHTLSGWNSNSPIFIVPIMLFGLSCIAVTDFSNKRMLILLMGTLDAFMILKLGNRSALLAICLFFVGYLFPKIYKNKLYLIISLSALIIFNVAAPLFQEIVVNSDIYKSAINLSASSVEKSGGLNGREELWFMALKIIDIHPLLGNYGSRYLGIYFHNFSLDILIQFGWVGWLAFFSMYIFIIIKCFTPDSVANIFLWGFICLLLLNTFENAMVCNDYFTIFPYILLAVPLFFKSIGREAYTDNEFIDCKIHES